MEKNMENREILDRIKGEIREELQSRSQVEDEELYECIDQAIAREASCRYLPVSYTHLDVYKRQATSR